MISNLIGDPLRILLVEDNPGDAMLTKEAMDASRLFIHMDHVEDAVEAMNFLNRSDGFEEATEPDLILLDLNLPGDNGHKILSNLRNTENLKHIPVVVLTSSERDEDILESYTLGANSYVTKPVGLEQFAQIVESLEDFWFTIVRLPSKKSN